MSIFYFIFSFFFSFKKSSLKKGKNYIHDPLPETLALDMEPSTLDEKIIYPVYQRIRF